MNQLNSILLEGCVAKKPVPRKTQTGTEFCNFPLVSTRFYKNGENLEKEVSAFNIETWSRLAQMCQEECKEGRVIRVVGRLRQHRWTDKEGRHHSNVVVIAEHVEFRPESVKAGYQEEKIDFPERNIEGAYEELLGE